MIFGLADNAFGDYEPQEQEDPVPSVSPLDSQIDALKVEIKTLEREILAQQAARQLNEEASEEKKQKELADLTRQIQSFKKSFEYEQKKVKHFELEIAKREGRLAEQQQALALQPDSEFYDEQAVAITAQNNALEQELRDLHKDIANEVGEGFDIDALLKTGGTARKRSEKLQKLRAEYSRLQGQAMDSKVKSAVDEAAGKANKNIEELIEKKAQLEVSNDTMRNKISRNRAKCDALEEESRALRMMDILLDEKLKHDEELIKHLRKFQDENPENLVLPEEEVPPVTYELVDQLRTQQNIIKGLLYKLGLAQKEMAEYTVPESFEFLVEQLGQLNQKCKSLSKALLTREAIATDKIERHVQEE